METSRANTKSLGTADEYRARHSSSSERETDSPQIPPLPKQTANCRLDLPSLRTTAGAVDCSKATGASGSRAMVTSLRANLSADIDAETLFRRYAGFVAAFLFRLGARQTEIDDLVQDVFLTAHRKGGYRAGAASPTTFLARLALEANLARRRRESRWRAARSDEVALATVGGQPADPGHALAVKRAAKRLQDALDSIEPGQRAVFILFELDGESCESIAAGLEIKLGTVYSRLHAARKSFSASVAREERRSENDLRRPLNPVDALRLAARHPSRAAAEHPSRAAAEHPEGCCGTPEPLRNTRRGGGVEGCDPRSGKLIVKDRAEASSNATKETA